MASYTEIRTLPHAEATGQGVGSAIECDPLRLEFPMRPVTELRSFKFTPRRLLTRPGLSW